MITHDEARIEAVSYNCESIRVILKYIAQQEKKDELLGLYRERKELQNYRGEHPEEYYEVDEQITEIEEEVK